MKNIACVILAAGKGERMKSRTPKVLHELCGRPMLEYVFDLVKALKITRTAVVLGYKHEEVKKYLPAGVKIAVQKKLLGTADAVKQALPLLGGAADILVLYGDIPLLTRETLKKLLDYHAKNNADATVLTAEPAKPQGYGRIIRDKYSSICGIVEEKDANDAQKEIKEVNTGIICFRQAALRRALKQIRANNRKREYYLTDAIAIIYKDGGLVEGLKAACAQEAMGINSRVDLAQAQKVVRSRINETLMKEGVTIIDPESAFISYGVKIGGESVIYPFTVIEKGVKIGRRCFVGPFAHLREGTRLEDDVVAGNFLEIVRSKISAKTWVKHFGYIGDSLVGRAVNIGAGAVTANFDSGRKNRTVIKDGAFIGSDTVMVAPVTVGRRAKTGAGSVLVKNSRIGDGIVVVGVPARIIKNKGKNRG